MSRILEENEVKMLRALELAKGPAPLGYIARHSGINDPYDCLCKLEEYGLVCRSPQGDYSLSRMPLFELTGKAKNLLQQSIVERP